MTPPLLAGRETTAQSVPAARPWRRAVPSVLFPLLAAPVDAAAVAASFYLAHRLRFSAWMLGALPLPGMATDWASFMKDLGAIVPLWLFLFHYSARLYEEEELGAEDQFLRAAKGCLFGVLATLAFGFLYHRFDNSRLMILLSFPIAAALVTAGRLAVRRLHRALSRALVGRARILILGGGRTAEHVRRRAEGSGLSVCESLPRASLEEVLAVLDARPFAEVVLAQMNLGKADILRLSEACEKRGVGLKIVPGLLELRMGEVQIDRSLGVPTFRIYHAQFSTANFGIKRAFDLLFCAAFFAVFALPWLVISLLIKLDSRGPILFKQKRVGYKGLLFEIYKFRTMVVDAETRLEALRHLNERQGPVFKMRRDPRITRVGAWLRRFSLDEVPQFLNVLKGQMSVVGPRPPLPREVEQYDEAAAKRLNVLPGITGLGQIGGRADLDFHQQVALDLYYLEHWSPGMDLKIILKTPGAVLSSKGAY